MNISEFKRTPTEFKRIAIYSVLGVLIIMFLTLAAIIGFWMLYGEGAGSSTVANTYRIDLIIMLAPLTLVSAFFTIKAILAYKAKALARFKTFTVSGIAVILVYGISFIAQRLF